MRSSPSSKNAMMFDEYEIMLFLIILQPYVQIAVFLKKLFFLIQIAPAGQGVDPFPPPAPLTNYSATNSFSL